MPGTNPHILAIIPLLTETVRFRISGTSGNDPVDGGAKCRALVRPIEPDAANIGAAKDGERWTVRFIVSELITFNRLAKGSVIEADNINKAWPQLTVQERPRLKDGICTLTCSARELGGIRP